MEIMFCLSSSRIEQLVSCKIKSGKNIMYTFTSMVHIANVYIILYGWLLHSQYRLFTIFDLRRLNGLATRRQAFGLFSWILIGQTRRLILSANHNATESS